MILDSLENSGLYESIHPRFKQAFDFLRNNDLAALPLGKVELDGKNLFVNVVDAAGKTPEVAKMETHNKYIDIQVPVTAPETMGWISGSKLKEITDPYNEEKDLSFFADKASNFIVVQPFEFAVFFPQDGHQPQIFEGTIKKLIVKVLM
ncbi:MAG TPA: YhcH/YjgK/YiaL family protein [Paludibacter sp.]|nr:YhcH/YjgK/YiaL family protein [Paludibacter sp.]